MKTPNNHIVVFLIALLSLFFAITAFSGNLEDANKLFVRQKYDEAISKYQTALKEAVGEDIAYIHFYLGRAFEMKNEWKKAFAEFDRIRTEYPKHPIISEAIHEIGQCHVRFQHMDDAIESFDEVIKLADDPWIKASSLLSKAILQCSSNKNVFNLDSASQSLKSVIDDYNFADMKTKAWYWLGYIYNIQKEHEKAITAWENVIKEGPETLWADIVPWYITVARQKIGKVGAADAQENVNLRAQRFIRNFNQAAANQNINDETFYITTIEDAQAPGEMQLVEFGRLDLQGRKNDQFFMWAKSIRYENEKGIIFGSGGVKIANKINNPQFTLEAEEISISIEDLNARANGSVQLILKNTPKPGIDTEMRNHDFIGINLQTKEFNVSKSKQ